MLTNSYEDVFLCCVKSIHWSAHPIEIQMIGFLKKTYEGTILFAILLSYYLAILKNLIAYFGTGFF